jgi:hypothetical protein
MIPSGSIVMLMAIEMKRGDIANTTATRKKVTNLLTLFITSA